ncbi:MAG: flagellar basal body L-ring protein FlgH [Pseudomonadota bacterium]
MKILVTFLIFIGCQTSQVSRPIPAAAMLNKSAPKSAPVAKNQQNLLVENRAIDFKKNEIDSSGSLFQPNNPHTHLFGAKLPLSVGDFVTVKVVPIAQNAEPQKSNSNASDSKVVGDALTQELLAAMPNLGGEETSKNVMSEIPMEITSISSTGDLSVKASRTSQVEGNVKYLSVEAVIPGRIAGDNTAFSTKDLRRIQFHEDGSESVRRSNDSWLDEYSLRYSGFSETASKNARQLAEDKRRLDDVRTRLDNRIKAFSTERTKMTEERAKIFQDATNKEAKIAEASKKISDREQEIETLKSQLQEEQKKREEIEAKLVADEKAKAGDQPASTADSSKSSPANDKQPKIADTKAVKNVAKK